LIAELRIARTGAPKPAKSFTADVEVAVAVHVESSEYRLVRNIDRRLPCNSGVSRTVEYPDVATSLVIRLILEAMSRSAGLIDCEPLFVAADRALLS
jgi:hypothetical protein